MNSVLNYRNEATAAGEARQGLGHASADAGDCQQNQEFKDRHGAPERWDLRNVETFSSDERRTPAMAVMRTASAAPGLSRYLVSALESVLSGSVLFTSPAAFGDRSASGIVSESRDSGQSSESIRGNWRMASLSTSSTK